MASTSAVHQKERVQDQDQDQDQDDEQEHVRSPKPANSSKSHKATYRDTFLLLFLHTTNDYRVCHKIRNEMMK